MHPWWPAAWIAPIPLLLAVLGAESGSEAALLCLGAGLLGLSSNFHNYWNATRSLPAAAVSIFLQALAIVLVMGVTRGAARRWNGAVALFVYPTFWAGLGTLAVSLSREGTRGGLAVSQAGFPAVLQIASVAGPAAVAFVVCLFASATAFAIHCRREWIGAPSPRWRLAFVAAAILVAGPLAFGAMRLAGGAPSEFGAIRVGAVAIDDFLGFVSDGSEAAPRGVGPRLAPERVEAVLKAYDDAISRFARAGARLAALPEKIAVFDAAPAARLRARFSEDARRGSIYVMAGLGLVDGGVVRNVAWLIDPSGKLIGYYEKQHPADAEPEVASGSKYVVADVDSHPIGLAVCHDKDFPAFSREYGREGVSAVFYPSWDFGEDGWIASRWAVLRGVEGGFAVVHDAREGVIAMSDRCGRIVAEAPSCKLPGATLLATLPLGPAKPTVYDRLGDLFGWVCAAIALGICAGFRRRRGPGRQEAPAIRPKPTP
jgi:apolipoprotein N-acyltransferase